MAPHFIEFWKCLQKQRTDGAIFYKGLTKLKIICDIVIKLKKNRILENSQGLSCFCQKNYCWKFSMDGANVPLKIESYFRNCEGRKIDGAFWFFFQILADPNLTVPPTQPQRKMTQSTFLLIFFDDASPHSFS